MSIKIDQTLTQDATGTLVYLEFESIGVKTIKTQLSVSYVDHNTLQTGFENSDDHKYLKTVAQKYGLIFSPAGNGICHQLHLENFSVAGQTLLGSDSHTPTCGAVGMLAIGAGGLDVACALAGYPFFITMPEITNVILSGKLQTGVSAKDLILEILRRFTVQGGHNRIFEYSGDGLKNLSIYDRATITNMGTELGLTSSIFPSDNVTKEFFIFHNRIKQWKELLPDKDAQYDDSITFNMDEIEPLIACPHSPDNVKKIKELEGKKIDQVCIGSCTNSSLDDLILVANILKNHKVHPDVELTISPGSKQMMLLLSKNKMLDWIINSEARLLEPVCGPCIGNGQVPPSGGVSLRTFNRNFRGRSGNPDAEIYLCSTETAIVSAICGEVTDPKKFLKREIPKLGPSKKFYSNFPKNNFIYPLKPKEQKKIVIFTGPNIKPLPQFLPLEKSFISTVSIKLGDNISTDDILPAGSKILALRSNIPSISEYTFSRIDPDFLNRVEKIKTNSIVIAGTNYGQGSSREHAAIVLRYLGINAIVSKSFSRIHLSNLINFGILPLIFENPSDYDIISVNAQVKFESVKSSLLNNKPLIAKYRKRKIILSYNLDEREKQIILAGGLINTIRFRS